MPRGRGGLRLETANSTQRRRDAEISAEKTKIAKTLLAFSALISASLRLIVVPGRKIIFGFLDLVFATERRCSFHGFSTLQTFATALVGVGVPPLRIFASGSPMPSQSRSSGGVRLVPETNTQKFSGPGLYYKTFAGIKLAPLERNLVDV